MAVEGKVNFPANFERGKQRVTVQTPHPHPMCGTGLRPVHVGQRTAPRRHEKLAPKLPLLSLINMSTLHVVKPPRTSVKAASATRFDAALLIIRIAVASVFLYHGSAILFGAFGGPGPQKFAAFMHMPAVIGYLVGLAQFAGGLAVLTGVLIRVGAVCIGINMLYAVLVVHLPFGFSLPKGMEFALTELLLALALLLTGAGRLSLAGILPDPLRKL